MVTNPAVRPGTVHIRILDPKQPLIVDFKLCYSTDKIVVVIVNCFLNALDGWAPPCPFHPVPQRRCKLAAFPKRAIILYISLRTSSRSEIAVVNQFWARWCGRVAQSELRTASGKTHTYVYVYVSDMCVCVYTCIYIFIFCMMLVVRKVASGHFHFHHHTCDDGDYHDDDEDDDDGDDDDLQVAIFFRG